ncbi:hypothetical protein X927_07005 [Petrotoga mexicana DSM 14811]|uniref:Uncharacterized protein n=1 Tax=Petrotoga mexicana DSM 14811 TaxID=1122954 RepID=A0A2K1P7X9_9BACT|nr:hypothetical protein X927_07005 [Petrotoga mexicana DSM 14811]
MQGGKESSLANHPGTILALGHLFTKEIIKKEIIKKEIIKKIKRQIFSTIF